MNQSVYEEAAVQYTLKPRIRTYKEKSRRSAITDTGREKEQTRNEMIRRIQEDRRKIALLEHADENCVVHCEDGTFTMPRLSIIFEEV